MKPLVLGEHFFSLEKSVIKIIINLELTIWFYRRQKTRRKKEQLQNNTI